MKIFKPSQIIGQIKALIKTSKTVYISLGLAVSVEVQSSLKDFQVPPPLMGTLRHRTGPNSKPSERP